MYTEDGLSFVGAGTATGSDASLCCNESCNCQTGSETFAFHIISGIVKSI